MLFCLHNILTQRLHTITKKYNCRIYNNVNTSDVCIQCHISMMSWTYQITGIIVGKLIDTCILFLGTDETCDVGTMSMYLAEINQQD